jgi:hypothetical protein
MHDLASTYPAPLNIRLGRIVVIASGDCIALRAMTEVR